MVEGDLVECIVALPGQLFYTTQIPVSLWFLNRDKTSRGSQEWRDRKGEVLFIDARKLGHMVDRTHRELTDDEIARIADTTTPGVANQGLEATRTCQASAPRAHSEQIAEHRYVLTPGRYVGAEDVEDDGEPIEEKLARLKAELFVAFDENDRLQDRVRIALGRLDV